MYSFCDGGIIHPYRTLKIDGTPTSPLNLRQNGVACAVHVLKSHKAQTIYMNDVTVKLVHWIEQYRIR